MNVVPIIDYIHSRSQIQCLGETHHLFDHVTKYNSTVAISGVFPYIVIAI